VTKGIGCFPPPADDYFGLLYFLAKGKIGALEVTALPESVQMSPRDETALAYSAAADKEDPCDIHQFDL